MFSIRARTFSGLSSFLLRSFGFNGSRWPSAHWPSPRALRTGRAGRTAGADGSGVAPGRAGVLLSAIAASSGSQVSYRWTRGARRPAPSGARDNGVSGGRHGARPKKQERAASVSRTDRAADTAVVNVATGHEAAVNGSLHKR